MLLTNRDDLADKVRILSLHGMDRDAWKRYMKGGSWVYDVVEVGYKCNMPDTAAALALSQLRKLPALQARRDRIAQRYLQGLGGIAGLKTAAKIPDQPDRHSWCVFAILVEEETAGISRDNLIEELKLRNIGTSVHFIPTHHFSAYQNVRKTDLRATEKISKQIVSLPLYPGLADEDVDYIVGALRGILEDSQRKHRPISKSVKQVFVSGT